MSLLGVVNLYSHSSVSTEEDFLIRKILLTHDPNGSQVDSKRLLRTLEDVIHFATPMSELVYDPESYATSIFNAEAIGLEETLGYIIFKISHEILSRCFEEGDLHTKTMFLFEILGHFEWDAKVVIVVAAFLMYYGEFQLIMQLQCRNPLAALVALVRQLPCELSAFRRQFKALTLLVNTMMELTKVIVDFENFPLKQELLEFKEISTAKSKLYVASYWIFRSSFACFSLFSGLRTKKHDQVDTNSTTGAALTIFSLVYRLSGLCCNLRAQVQTCHEQIATRLYEKLLNLSRLNYIDNQEKLRMLIPTKDDFPLKDCLSQEKHSISELKNKVVIILLSKPELLPMEKIFFLVQQTCDHPHQKEIKESYLILWLPITSSHTWNQADEISFQFLSNSLPFWSLRHPWLLNSAVVKYIIKEWSYKDETMMVVIDTNGILTHSNAMDMVWIWGAKAFPFSTSKEKELWEMENWTLQLIIDDIDTLLTSWIRESKNICIYASENLDWIRNFSAKMKEIKETGLQLEVIYVGWRNPSERLRNILDMIKQDNLGTCLTLTKICFFWFRLESMKNSIMHLEHASSCDDILKEVLGLLEVDNNDDSWMLIGTGPLSELIKLQGRKLTECFDLFPVWAENVGDLGLVGAIRSALEPPSSMRPCHHSDILPYKEKIASRDCNL